MIKSRNKRLSQQLENRFFDFVFGNFLHNGEFFQKQGSCRIQHLSFAKRKLFISFQDRQIPKHLGKFIDGSGLDFFHVLPVAPVPCTSVDGDFPPQQDIKHPRDVGLGDKPSQSNSLHSEQES